jgi:hypothetical protein
VSSFQRNHFLKIRNIMPYRYAERIVLADYPI